MAHWKRSGTTSSSPRNAHPPGPFADTKDEPARRAFNDLATITARGHTALARALEERYLRTYEWCAWAVGMPKMNEIKPRKTAIVVMNAGQGIGRSLSLEFASAGYTVFGLVHQDLSAFEDGSIGQLMVSWQQRRAELLSRRAQRPPRLQDVAPGTIGNLLPIPIRPLSGPSRHKARQTITAYCSSQELHLHTIILTPIYTTPSAIQAAGASTDSEKQYDYYDPKGKGLTSGQSAFSRGVKIEERDWEIPFDPNSPVEMVPVGALIPHPPTMAGAHQEVSVKEGSYIPMFSAHQSVTTRAMQREVSEQLSIAQMFSDLLVSEEKKVVETPRKSFWQWKEFQEQLKKEASVPKPVVRSPPPPFSKALHMAVTPDMDDEVEVEDDEAEAEDFDYELYERAAEPSTYHFIKLMLMNAKKQVNDVFSEWYPEAYKAGGGKLLWVTGGGETSFLAGEGSNGVIDAARERMAQSLNEELSTLGAQVSLVTTGPLLHRSLRSANTLSPSGELDPRTNFTSRSDVTMIKNHNRQMLRAHGFFARISTLWALDEASCFWIVRRAVEAPYHKRTYTLGLDLLVKRYALALVPDGVRQIASHVVYERLGGAQCEAWFMGEPPADGYYGTRKYDKQTFVDWVTAKPLQLAYNSLAFVARRMRARAERME